MNTVKNSPPGTQHCPPPNKPGGWAVDPQKTCPPNYPKDAPLQQCGHYALVEMDGAMSYKYALAHAATGDEWYALRAAEALLAWSAANVHFGLNHRNGPLEAAWCVLDWEGDWIQGDCLSGGVETPRPAPHPQIQHPERNQTATLMAAQAAHATS